MIELLKEYLVNNPAISAIYSGGIVATLVMHSKTIFVTLKDYILNLISFDMTNVSRDVGYNDSNEDNFSIFLQNQKPIFQRNYEIRSSGKISTGFGLQWYIIFGKIASVRREIETSNGTMILRTFIRVYFANKKKFIEKLQSVINKPINIYENKVTINFQYHVNKRDKRSLSSIYTNNSIHYNILKDIQHFIKSKQFYNDNNIPYKRNYLLYGKPGTGKTSLIFSLASELNYNIRVIDLGSLNNDTNSLLYQIYNCTDNTILVFEDIDAMSGKFDYNRDKNNNNTPKSNINSKEDIILSSSDSKELSLSILLNLLDGLYTREGIISFFTTNHIDRLDDAFLRDGRMDIKIELKDLDNTTANKMILDKTGLSNVFKGDCINPSTLQELIIRYKLNNINKVQFIKEINNV